MAVSREGQYALRAVLELARRRGQGPITIGSIAQARSIPPRFLELILNRLKQGRFVESRRGIRGGYQLAVEPEKITVGAILRITEDSVLPHQCLAGLDGTGCSFYSDCAFRGLWHRVNTAMLNVYDQTTMRDLLREPSA